MEKIMVSRSKDNSGINGENSSGNALDSNSECLFVAGEKVLAYHDPAVYEAKAMPSTILLGMDRLMKHTEENVLKQHALDTKVGVDKNAKSRRSSQVKPKSSSDSKLDKEETKNNVAKGNKRKAGSSIELVKLPRSPNVEDIFARKTDAVGEILKGSQCYFNKALPVVLLYKTERDQYHEVVPDNVTPSSIYGAEHLLHLFVKLSQLLAYVKIDEETLIRMQQKLHKFLKYTLYLISLTH
ncbi:Hypothetical predicted protein [Olea europaea subsp. europaea]|uniref:MRG domain-containing protein n=1 Tax=Olea europaea subsp. europaea TaxID=158383 RepID=A0A8S0QFW6_OLEEU|nr:Hypothetical predicted protein [Olea europaea subsp. europaea]